jgi:hypothetical protein
MPWTVPPISAPYAFGVAGSNECPTGTVYLADVGACQTAATAAGAKFFDDGAYANYPKGCYAEPCRAGWCISFNTPPDAVGSAVEGVRTLCSAGSIVAPTSPSTGSPTSAPASVPRLATSAPGLAVAVPANKATAMAVAQSSAGKFAAYVSTTAYVFSCTVAVPPMGGTYPLAFDAVADVVLNVSTALRGARTEPGIETEYRLSYTVYGDAQSDGVLEGYGVWEEIVNSDVGVPPTSTTYAGQFRAGRLHGTAVRTESIGPNVYTFFCVFENGSCKSSEPYDPNCAQHKLTNTSAFQARDKAASLQAVVRSACLVKEASCVLDCQLGSNPACETSEAVAKCLAAPTPANCGVHSGPVSGGGPGSSLNLLALLALLIVPLAVVPVWLSFKGKCEAKEKAKQQVEEQTAQQKRAERQYLGAPESVVPEEKCKWACFISHHQADASHQVLWLGNLISERLKQLGERLTVVWIDKNQKATEEGMREGVRLSQHFILFLTKEVLTRDFCIKEICMALEHRKNVILVYQADKRHGGVPGNFFDFYGPELKKAFPNAEDIKWLMKNSYVQFDDRGQHVDVMLHDEQCENGILDQMKLESRNGHAGASQQ